MNIQTPQQPKIVCRAKGKWDVILDDSKAPKEITKIAGDTLIEGEWFFTSEASAKTAAWRWWIDKVTTLAGNIWKPSVIKPAEPVIPWWIEDRALGYKFND